MKKVDISVGQLVDEVKSGEIQLPVMQRRYVWRAKQVRDLLDSLYRGYPSGSILVWETLDQREHDNAALAERLQKPALLVTAESIATMPYCGSKPLLLARDVFPFSSGRLIASSDMDRHQKRHGHLPRISLEKHSWLC
jgi:hypothetical protein